jgi:hypothetical protein
MNTFPIHLRLQCLNGRKDERRDADGSAFTGAVEASKLFCLKPDFCAYDHPYAVMLMKIT